MCWQRRSNLRVCAEGRFSPAVILALLSTLGLTLPVGAVPAPAGTQRVVGDENEIVDDAPNVVLKGCGGYLAAFSRDGGAVFTYGKNGMRVWSTKTFEPIGPPVPLPRGDTTEMYLECARVVGANAIVLLQTRRGAVILNARAGRLGREFISKGEICLIGGADVSSDGSRVLCATFSDQGGRNRRDALRAWNAESGDLLWKRDLSAAVIFSGFSPDGKSILADELGDKTRTFRLLGVATGKDLITPITIPDKDNNSDYPPAFSGDGAKIALRSTTHVTIVDATNGRVISEFDDPDMAKWNAPFAFTADGKRLVTRYSVRDITARDVGSGRVVDEKYGLLIWRHVFKRRISALLRSDASIYCEGNALMVPTATAFDSVGMLADGPGRRPTPIIERQSNADRAFSPDGSVFAIGDPATGDTLIWRVDAKEMVVDSGKSQ